MVYNQRRNLRTKFKVYIVNIFLKHNLFEYKKYT